MHYSIYNQVRFLSVVNQATLLPVFFIHRVDELHAGEHVRQLTEEKTFVDDHDQFVR